MGVSFEGWRGGKGRVRDLGKRCDMDASKTYDLVYVGGPFDRHCDCGRCWYLRLALRLFWVRVGESK